MWIFLTLTCAFSQALWIALSKRQLQTLSSTQFMLFLRIPILLVMVLIFAWCEHPLVTLRFWAVATLTAALECVRLIALARGTRRDYYATYSLLNMSPIFVLLLAPQMLAESLTVSVVAGALFVVVGGFIFYYAGRFQMAGLVAAIVQGAVTTLCKLGLSLSSPTYFMVVLYGISTAMLFGVEGLRGGFGHTMRAYQKSVRQLLPLSSVNLVAIISFMFGLNLAPATHFAILFRTSLIFGFILSLLLLKEHSGWKSKLAGTGLILIGSVLIVLKNRH